MLHALIIVENSYPPFDIRVWYEATTLRDAGWQVSVICPTAPGTPPSGFVSEDLDGVTLHRFPLARATTGKLSYLREYGAAFSAIARLARRVWRTNRFDVLHLCNPPDVFFPIALYFRLRGVRIIFDHHDLFPETIAARYRGGLGRLLYGAARVSERLTFSSAHVVLSTNESYRRVALRRGHKSPENVIVVRNGPRLTEFQPVAPDPALKEGFDYLVCYAGVMGQEDGVGDMLASIRLVVQDLGRDDVLFVLLGDGSARQDALQSLAAWGLDDRVRLPGLIRDKALLRRYLATADVCLSPEPLNALNVASTFIKVGEYMAMGTPVVAYDLPETRQSARDAALYVTPGDTRAFAQAIVTLLDDPARRQVMGESGRQRVTEALAWEHQQPHLLRAYTLERSPEAPMNNRCQLHDIPQIATGNLDAGPLSPYRRAKMMLKRRLSPRAKRRLKQRYTRLFDFLVRRERAPADLPPAGLGLQAGDRVRVRSAGEIKAMLTPWGELNGCAFMDQMWQYCGTTQTVLKPVRQFLDERDYRMKKTRGIVLLEGAICPGMSDYGPCDRSCYFFWREEWLEKIAP
jgi:glycosyltransferase involved in cell wall biosynthesis